MELRHRGNRSDNIQPMETFQILQNPSDEKDEAIRNQKYILAVPTLLVTMIMLIILNAFVYYMDYRLPSIVKTNHSSYDEFVAKRAMYTLIKLANLGPRPVGSYENENLAFNLLISEINNITNERGNVNDIEMYNQKVSGSFILDMKNWKYVLSYKDLQNVVVKVDPKQGFNEAILLNCHFDSVPAGPGVSDNGVNCAIMVELLRILAKTADLKRPVIFLFNGGEEIILQASHGFITQHPWFQNAKYIINLDSCGAGGREIMFQTTVSDSYLVDLYARTVPHPHGQAIGEELFQSGLIPSDTDFRIFRDFGNLSGLDLAHYKNGYVYHTKYDNLDQIGPSVLQNTGENLFAIARAMSTHNTTKTQRSKYVFFDVLGVYMFCYTEMSGAFANFMIVLMSFYSIVLSLKYTTIGMNRKEYSMHLLTLIANPACSMVSCLMSCGAIAFVLDAFGRSMSWYNNQINLIVYVVVASLTILSVAVFYPKCESRTHAQWAVSTLNGAQLFWTLALFLATIAGLRSSYVLAVVVACPAAVSCALGVLGVAGRSPALWTAVYAASLLVPATFVFYLTQLFVDLFVPIAGRLGGPHVNPDYVVAALIAASASVTVGHVAPAVALVRKPRVMLAALATLALVSAATIVLTPLGFPYSAGGEGDHATQPRPERFDVIHTRRAFYDGHDKTTVPRHRDAGYLIVNWDRHSLAGPVSAHVPLMRRAERTDCTAELMCGVPITGPLALHSSWIPLAPVPAIAARAETNVRVTAVDSPQNGGLSHRRRMEFTVTGPERINVYVSPYPGTGIKSWSFNTDGPPEATTTWQGHDVYVIRHSRGAAGEDAPWNFWLEQESDRGFNEKTINVTVAYNWAIHANLKLDDEFKTFIDSFPRWAHVNHAVASVDAFVY